MGALIRLTCEHLEQASPRIETAFGTLELRGRHAVLGGIRVALTPVALALFRTLVAAEGATVARHVLAASAPEALDDHAVDVAVSRLRQALPEPRLVATVIKRGYRLATPL
jgi:uroporphyrinogen-III synthase